MGYSTGETCSNSEQTAGGRNITGPQQFIHILPTGRSTASGDNSQAPGQSLIKPLQARNHAACRRLRTASGAAVHRSINRFRGKPQALITSRISRASSSTRARLVSQEHMKRAPPAPMKV
ncbi:hypothetical protein D9M68_692790 [compost metagenome]